MNRKLFLTCASLLVGTTAVVAQVRTVKGVITSKEDGEPVVGASIVVKGTTIGTVSNMDGSFALSNVPANAKTLVISFIGMKTTEVPVGANVRVVMESDAELLDDVVVVAYGTAKKESVTGAVSMVDAQKIEKRIGTSVTSALEGSTSGVQVNSTYGEPGAAPQIMIRGFSTFVSGAGTPLYVVDGIPFDGNIAEINPNDIASMSVLKDASSAALYGSRAANGVVLITTKSGRNSGKPQVTLQINQGAYTRGLKEYDRLGADQWMEASWIAMKNYATNNPALVKQGVDPAAYATETLISGYAKRNIYDGAHNALFDANGKLTAKRLPGYDDLDWFKGVERTGHRQEYNISANVAHEKYSVYGSLGYLEEEGYILATDYTRYSARVNTTFTPNKWMKIGLNISGQHAKRNYNPDATGSFYANPFSQARGMAPIYPLYLHNDDGTYLLDENGNKQFDTTSEYLGNRNIAYELRADQVGNVRNILGGQAFFTFMLPYNFSLTLKGDMNVSTTNYTKYNNSKIGDGAANNGRYTFNNYRYKNYTAQQLINWNHSYGLHNIEAMIGHENYSWERKYMAGMNTGMAVEGNITIGNFLTNSYLRGYDDKYRTDSYLARAKYNFDERYYVEASFRRDGSSRFYKDNRWGNFYSFGFNWNAKREKFLQDVAWINTLRARISYGEVGNDRPVNYYGYMALYYIAKNAGNPALVKSNLEARKIKWETTQTFDLAVEGRLWDRVNFSLGYFDKRSDDLLFEVRLPLSAGSYYNFEDFANQAEYQNIGILSNRGLEFSADVDIIRTQDFRWNFGVDLTYLRGKVVKLPNSQLIQIGQRALAEGKAPYSWYTYHYVGVDQYTGRSLYTLDPAQEAAAKKANATIEIDGVTYTTKTSYAERQWAGKVSPDVYGSFNTSLAYKDLSLSMLFTYGLGGKVYDYGYRTLMSTNTASTASSMHKDILNSWNGVPDGITATSPNRIDPNGLPALDFYNSSDNNDMSDRWLESGSYLVFKNINLSYTLPKKWTSAIGLEGITVSGGVENIFTMTARRGLNPQISFNGETDNTYVTPRVYNFGLTVKF